MNAIREILHDLSPNASSPVDLVRWIPIEGNEANDYNPNAVAQVEMGLLQKSIEHDGYTQPLVTIFDAERGKFIIVDGFHRYFVGKNSETIRGSVNGRLPCVIIEKDINDRMASTVRHNRARGKHSIGGMASMVFAMLENGWTDAEICNELGMEPEEVLRLKHITGFSRLFENAEYSRAWVTKTQTRVRLAAEAGGDK